MTRAEQFLCGYEPTVFDVFWRPLMWIAQISPWLHIDDHPTEDLE